MTIPAALLWLREDLRFDDNPAMRAAVETGAPIICLYILDEETPGEMQLGGAQRWWLHHSLRAFMSDLETRGGKLILRRGDPRLIIPQLAEEIGATEVFWNRRYLDWQTNIDTEIKQTLKDEGRQARSFNGRLLYEPWAIETKTGGPYRVFSPFWRAIQARDDVRPALPKVNKLRAPHPLPASDQLEDWALLPTSPNWANGFSPLWTPGEKGARARFRTWLKQDAAGYKDLRNRPDLDQTSRLSPHLHFGEISPVTIWHAVRAAMVGGDIPDAHGKSFLSEVVWREFSYHLLYHNPTMIDDPLQSKFSAFSWNEDAQGLEAWKRGLTGYPIVDAGMRQLWLTGWMHNRVRMIVGSFLVKDLLLDWQLGMAWFWDTLVDADGANNTASWQWIAGCGADAAPFFRVFNPTTQGEKFDPEGDYVRRFVPELAHLPAKFIHSPSAAPLLVLKEAGVELGVTYPLPIVEHKLRREEALNRYQAIK